MTRSESHDLPPALAGEAAAAVTHRGSHMQIIAAAGSGKTEVVSQRVADLVAEEVDPRNIVAFTFTERAAAELKQRIASRVEARLGPRALDRLSGLFVGTIHSYCFQLLQRYVSKYETYDVLDENQATALLSREAQLLGVRRLHSTNRLFSGIKIFRESLDVVENELLDPASVPGTFGEVLRRYLDTLDRYRLLTFGQQIVRTVRALEDSTVAAAVHADVRHLIVDEYQDVNPAQERLIELLVAGGAELCVVGDDDQAIYQWRGSDIGNIVKFTDRYPNVTTFSITTNRRSRPAIVSAANEFALSIPGRLDKQMGEHREPSTSGASVVTWSAPTIEDEADRIATMIRELHDQRGIGFRDMAVLVRGRVSYPPLLRAFDEHGIPVQPGGRTGLFDAPEAVLFGKTFCWLTDIEWRFDRDPPVPVLEDDLLDEFAAEFDLDRRQVIDLRGSLRRWKRNTLQERKPADLISEFYEMCETLGVDKSDIDDPLDAARLGTLAHFSMLLADYESVRRRARPDAATEGEQVGGQDRGPWFYRNLAKHIVHYARGAYDGFDGEADVDIDAVDLTTIHRAKGLEWPVVFVPAMTARRFPSSKTGTSKNWAVPTSMFNAERYAGSDADERRLFYVAMTRARDLLSISRPERITTQRAAASPYFLEIAASHPTPAVFEYPSIETRRGGDQLPLSLSFSEASQFLSCGMAFRLRSVLGFQPRLAVELGYGKAVHHVLRAVADDTARNGRVPTSDELDQLLDERFFLPTANKVAHRQMKQAARRLIGQYVDHYPDDLFRVWEAERPFELRLDDITITGRADVVLDLEGGTAGSLAILDYKTSTNSDDDHDLQLQVYADAGRREGLDVRAGYIHDLKQARRTEVEITDTALAAAEQTIAEAAESLRARHFPAKPGDVCASCEVRAVCAARARPGRRRR